MTMPFFDDDPDGDRARDLADFAADFGPEPPEDYGRFDSDDEQDRREFAENGPEL